MYFKISNDERIMTKTLVRATFAAILLSFFSLSHVTHAQKAADEKPQTGLPKITLYAGGQTIHADVAATEGARQIGLMFRKQMGKNEGMMFVFPQLAYHAMWMKNTLIPLSVAYMDDNGKILSIHEMEPQTEISHQAAGPARFALEMNAAWFSTHKVNVGDTIKGLNKAPKSD